MESKKINQLATEMAPASTDLTIIGDPITGVSKKVTLLQIADIFSTIGTVTSVGVTETGDALTITGSPITSSGTINIGFAGAASQYVRGDGALADFPTSAGGGSSVSYYLNSSVSQGTIGGVAYRELSKEPVIGAGTDITISANGYIASYITDANDPALLEVPGGNFNCEFYFSVNSNAHNPYVYAELYKYDGTTFTLLGSSQSVPEYLTNGTTLSPYYFAIPVAASALTITDRLAIRIYANVDTRTVTLHTENNHLCQVVTTFSKGLTSLNNLTRQVQFFGTGTSGTDFAISSSTATHTFNLPVASATNTGKLSSTDWSTFNAKQPAGNYVTLDTTQTITGLKTFNTPVAFDNALNIKFDASITAFGGYYSLYAIKGSGSANSVLALYDGDTNKKSSLTFDNTNDYLYIFPSASGTIALTSQLTGGTVTSVGLSSATSGVTIGSSPITTSGTITLAIATASGSQNGLLSSTDWSTFNNKQPAIGYTPANDSLVVHLAGTETITGDKTYSGVNTFNTYQTRFTVGIAINQTLSGGAVGSHTVIGANVNGLNVNFPAGGYNSLNFASTSVGNTYTFPNATGTIALTSDLSSYLPLAGGTLTGALNGTSAVFSSTVQASAYRLTGMTAGSGALYWSSDRVTLANYNASGTVTIETGGGTTALTLASNQAATFSSSVNVVGTLVAGNASNIGKVEIGSVGSSSTAQASAYLRIGDEGAARFWLQQLNSTYDFTIRHFNSSWSNPLMTITSGGNVGIGTSSPEALANNTTLQIDGTNHSFVRTGTSNYGGYFFTIPTADAMGLSSVRNPVTGTFSNTGKAGSAIVLFGTSGDGYMTFSTSNANNTAPTERMRIGSNGNIGVGVTNSSVTRLLVQGVDTTGSKYVFVATDSAATNLLVVRNDGAIYTGTAANSPVNLTTGSAANVFVESGSGLLYRSTSSIKYKNNVLDYNKGLKEVMQLRPVSYESKSKSDEGKIFAGLIAEEIHDLGLTEFVQYAEDGTPDALAYSNMVSLLVKAIQELKTEIDELKNK